MSFWGATVITNLLSAIPVFGHDLVESNNAINLYNCTILTYFDPISGHLDNGYVGEWANINIPVLATIGTVSPHALKKGAKLRINKEDYLSIPSPFIAFLVGLIDGDGYIQITKTTKGYISLKLVICLSLEDISSLEYINSVLKIGKITVYRDRLNPICNYIINKTDLQEIIFPLLVHHRIYFLTDNRRAQFDLAMLILKNDIKLYKEIDKFILTPHQASLDLVRDNSEIKNNLPIVFELPSTPEGYIKLSFFKNWLVGFTNAEGSFLIKTNNDGCFQLKQRIHHNLFEAFKLLFDTSRNLSIENDKYVQFSVSSKNDIQKVINFFSFSGLHPLIGKKNIQYFKWLNNLENSFRYKNLNFPK